MNILSVTTTESRLQVGMSAPGAVGQAGFPVSVEAISLWVSDSNKLHSAC